MMDEYTLRLILLIFTINIINNLNTTKIMSTKDLLFVASSKASDIESLFDGFSSPRLASPVVRLYPSLGEFEIVYDWTSNIAELPDGAKCYDLRFSASNSIVRIHFRFKVSDNSVENKE